MTSDPLAAVCSCVRPLHASIRRSIRGKLQQDALPRTAPGISHRARRPIRAAGGGTSGCRRASPRAGSGRARRFHRRGALRPASPAHAHGVWRTAGRPGRRGGAILWRCTPAAAVRTGLHAVADLHGADAVRVSSEAASRGVETVPVATYFARRRRASNSLILGFASARPDALRAGMEQLAAAIEASRR